MRITTRISILAIALALSSQAKAAILPYEHEEDVRLESRLRAAQFPTAAEPGENVHVLFQNQEEAMAWAEQMKPRLEKNYGARKFELLPSSDPRYAKLQSYVHDLWRGYTALFPEQTKDLNEPPVVIFDTEITNAFVARYSLEPSPDKIAHAIVVLTGLLDMAGGVDNRAPISGIVAHELSHSVFRHLLPQYQERINHYFPLEETRIGYEATRHQELDATMNRWVSGARLAGMLTNEELRDLPSKNLPAPYLMRAWKQARTELYEKTKACSSANVSYSLWQGFQPISPLEEKPVIDHTKLPLISDIGRRLIEDETACLSGKNASLIALLSHATGIPEETLQSDPAFSEMAKEFEASADITSGFQKLVGPIREEMRKVESSVSLDKVGFYTYEEHADDVAVMVHRYLHLDSQALGKFFFSILPKADQAKCHAMIQNGQIPPLGTLSDAHRAHCYRYSHLQDLEKDIDQRREGIEAYASRYVRMTTGN